MLGTSTVFVLGAGVSHPYGFDTGSAVFERGRFDVRTRYRAQDRATRSQIGSDSFTRCDGAQRRIIDRCDARDTQGYPGGGG